MELGRHADARIAFDDALARFEVLGDKRDLGWALRTSADLYERVGEHAKRLAQLERKMAIEEELGEATAAADSLVAIGTAHAGLGDLAKALATAEQGLARLEALGDKEGAAVALNNMGAYRRLLRDLAGALAHYERAARLAREADSPRWIAQTHLGLSQVQRELGQYAKALETLEALRRRQKAANDKEGLENTFRAVCDVYYTRGDFARALEGYKQLLGTYEARGDRPRAAATLLQLGNCQNSLGDYARALTTFEEVLARQQALGDKQGTAQAFVNLGNVYTNLGDPDTAFVHLKRGFDLAVELGLKVPAAVAASNIGLTHLRRGNAAMARAAFEYALEGYRALGDPAGVALTLTNLAIAIKSLGDPARALEIHQEAAQLNEARGDAAGLAMAHACIGQTYLVLGDPEKARAALERGASVARSRRITRTLVLCLSDLAALHVDRGEPALALATAREALRETELLLGGLGEEQGATARAQWTNLFAVGAQAAMREGDAAAVFTFLESGRAGALLADLDSREAFRWKEESLPPELARLDEEAQAKERAARAAYDLAAQGGNREERQAAGKALDDATRGVHEVAGRIQRALKQQAAFFYPRARTIEETRAALTADQALVVYGLCRGEALALVLRPEGERLVALGRVADVVAACEALEARKPDADVDPAVAELRRLIVEPLKLEPEVRQVIVSPEGPLCYLPFGLLLGIAVALAPSGTTHGLLLEEQVAAGRGILALGDPDYAGASQGAAAIYHRGRPLAALPATRAEAVAIGTQTLLGPEANETKLREMLRSVPRWRAIHFACHGLVNPEKPLLSSLALSRAGESDGFFTALEVLRTRLPSDLVVLSACETATGKIVSGEGIVGLTHAFTFAGTPRVICSLWKVDDEATSALMKKFYELWNPKEGSAGLPAAEALREAQAFVRAQEKWKHPYYWAAWVLWGLP
jgi:tetratricopeptide (TPR) repeat protein